MAEVRSAERDSLLPSGTPCRGGSDGERERLLARLIELEREAQAARTSTYLAHDVANHLTTLLRAAEAGLGSEEPGVPKAALAEVLGTGRRIHDSLEALESFRLGRTGGPQTLPVAPVVEAVRRIAEPAARSQGVDLLILGTTSLRVTVDPALLEQALVALVLEAVRASACGGGRVVFSAVEAPDGSVRFSVRDTGSCTGCDAECDAPGEGFCEAESIASCLGATLHREPYAAGTRVDLELRPPG